MSAEQTPDIADLAAVLWRAEKDAQPHSIAYADTYAEEPSEYRRIVELQAAAVLDSPALAAAVCEAEQRALREAADEVGPALRNEVGGHTSTYSVRQWLRDRADRITEPVSHEAATSGEEE